MRIAVVSDIHGNVISLNAVLADIGRRSVDLVVCLGDVAAFGPQPREALAQVRALNGPVVMGNTDAWLLNPQLRALKDEDTRRIAEIELWCERQLSPADRDYVRTFQETVEVPLGDDAILLGFHGSPHSNRDVILATTPDEELEPMLGGFSATIMVGGHTHTPLLRRYNDALLLNPGSVGLPVEHVAASGRVRNPPWAEYALVTWEGGSLGVELRRIPVDVDAVIRIALDSRMPHAEWWARDWG